MGPVRDLVYCLMENCYTLVESVKQSYKLVMHS